MKSMGQWQEVNMLTCGGKGMEQDGFEDVSSELPESKIGRKMHLGAREESG